MLEDMPYFGEVLSVLTAVVWAFAVILFKKSGETVSPLALNLFKNVLAVTLFVPTLLIFGIEFLQPVPVSDYLVLLLSGIIGIGITDTLYFKSLNLLGASLMAIVACLYSPSVFALSAIFLGDTLSVIQLVGVALIVSAVLSTALDRRKQQIGTRNLILGIVIGALAMVGNAAGIILMKPVLDETPVLWVTLVRLVGALLVLVPAFLIHTRRRAMSASLVAVQGRIYLFGSSFAGTYFALMLWIGGMKFTQVSISAALNQTSNIFVFIFAALLLKEKITMQRVIAILLAVSGAMLVTFF
ncbi:MAG: DMT family transporter [candidate division Zixibacteria bacterium]|nr:DMT family transporter [candidate division Zixibacteria bacterium]MBU1471138.1 DMT family transporter [candidate division Zixibacteria bacterium]MBU2626654.1 DMT family transporter [candidate division Zixibacteria bacterium]